MINRELMEKTFVANSFSFRGIAEVTGLSHQTVMTTISGERDPKLSNLEKVLKALGLELVVRRKGE